MDIEWHIGDVIAKARRRRHLNQTELARRVGVNKATIVRAEDGDPKVARQTYLKIAVALGTELVALETEAARLQFRGAVLVARENLRSLQYAIDDLRHTVEDLSVDKPIADDLEQHLSQVEHLVERLPERVTARPPQPRKTETEPAPTGSARFRRPRNEKDHRAQ